MMSSTLLALIGGLIIGVSVSMLVLLNGRITGVSGILHNAINLHKSPALWQWLFIVGLVAGGLLAHGVFDVPVPSLKIDDMTLAVVAGLLVGVGTRIGNGCTSGHGICGNSRFSIRSVASTLTFMAAGALTVFVFNLVVGGAL